MKKLIPILLALLGTGAGVGAGIFLKPDAPAHPPEDAAAVECLPAADATSHEIAPMPAEEAPAAEREYVKMNNQFIVPVIANDRVRSMVVASLSIEVKLGDAQLVYSREPKLRDAFLRVMMDHANVGGFDGNFTDAHQMALLRRALIEAVRPILGETASDVLITEIARQDN